MSSGQGYTERLRLPLGSVQIARRMEVTGESAGGANTGLELVATVGFCGLLGGFWSLLLGGRVTSAVRAGLQRSAVRPGGFKR